MSATDELREMLTARGVEWTDENRYLTAWVGSMGEHCSAMEWRPTLTVLHGDLTPEQAIAVTLGRGECSLTDNGPWGYPYVCSACGASFDPDILNGEFNFCPNCGRRVTEVDE